LIKLLLYILSEKKIIFIFYISALEMAQYSDCNF